MVTLLVWYFYSNQLVTVLLFLMSSFRLIPLGSLVL